MTQLARGTAPARVARRQISPFPELMELGRLFQGLPLWTPDENTSTAWVPPVDIFEAGEEIIIGLEMPGVRKEDIQVELNDSTLTISGERRLEHEEQRESYHRLERRYGRFARSFTVPPNVDRDGLKAEYLDGILTLRLPKRDEARPRTIAVE
jgi:HSP20 family protein